MGRKTSVALRGTTRHLVGAMLLGKERTWASPRPELSDRTLSTHLALLVGLSRPVDVLEQRVEDATDTKGGLDDVWRKLAA
jgi:hypothetical protein